MACSASKQNWPQELADLVRQQSEGRLALAVDGEVGRHLVATQELPAGKAVLTETSLLGGSDEARSLRAAALPQAASGMLQAWSDSEEGGSNPLAHMDLFFAYARMRFEASKDASAHAAEKVERLSRWFCTPDDGSVDREAQTEKLEVVHDALRPEYKKKVSVDDLRKVDNVLARNAEEFYGALSCENGVSPRLQRRRFQGIFPCKDLIQHSCTPNCMTVAGPGSSGSTLPSSGEELVMQIVPTRRILAGEQLSWCYLPYWKQLLPTQLRRKALHENWGFLCRCRRCAGGESSPEKVMAYRCPAPSCGAGELCPTKPCAAQSGDPSVGHLAAIQAVESLRCQACGVTVQPGGGEGPPGDFEGYLERCLLAEAEAFNLPWRCLLGRDLAALPADCAEVLGEHHWLRADQASHEVENASSILQHRGLMETVGADLKAALAELAHASGTAAAAVERLLAESCDPDSQGKICSVAHAELLLGRALFSGLAADFRASADVHQRVLGHCIGAASAVAAAEELACSRRNFLEAALTGAELEGERERVQAWLGSDTAAGWGHDKDEGPDSFWMWSLRRMWLRPEKPNLEEEGAEEEAPEQDEEVNPSEEASGPPCKKRRS